MSTATEMLAAYLAAESKVLSGKVAKIGDRSFQLEDLPAIRAGRAEWEGRVAAEAGGAGAQSIGGRPFVYVDLSGR
jgi:hypothetical protein